MTTGTWLRSIATKISPKLSIKLLYFYYFRKRINLRHPKTLDEKIQWLKLNLYGKDPIYTQCADKLLVRGYVEESGCAEILNELVAVYDSPEQIEWEKLPKQCAIKWNYGNGFNIIVEDMTLLDKQATIKKLQRWGKEEPWLKTAEVQYKKIPKKIIIEKYLGHRDGKLPEDYKIYCFNGIPEYLFVCVGREKGKPNFYFFDRNWQLARINPDSITAPEGFTLPKPKHLKEMFDYAEKLSKRFPFVRVDFYDTDEGVFFGELTFTPAGGFDTARLPSTQLLMGDLLDLSVAGR